jgi:hypothetical protein
VAVTFVNTRYIETVQSNRSNTARSKPEPGRLDKTMPSPDHLDTTMPSLGHLGTAQRTERRRRSRTQDSDIANLDVSERVLEP